MRRTDPQFVLSRLKQAGVWSKKKLGQHFLIDETVLEHIIENANLNSNDTVVEVGPGLGVLTEHLISRVKRLLAFEVDPAMVSILKEDFPKLEVVAGDVLQSAPALLQDLGVYKVVANIPYQITTPLLKLFLESSLPAPISLTLLVQKEVGERLAAPPKHSARGYLSVVCQYFSEIRYVVTVPKTSFQPAPEVDSAVIHLAVKKERLFRVEEELKFLRFVHMAFVQKRKQLKNVLAGIWGVSPEDVTKLFTQLSLPETVRAQELDLDQWKSLYMHK